VRYNNGIINKSNLIKRTHSILLKKKAGPQMAPFFVALAQIGLKPNHLRIRNCFPSADSVLSGIQNPGLHLDKSPTPVAPAYDFHY
jgi:hypothetical protein